MPSFCRFASPAGMSAFVPAQTLSVRRSRRRRAICRMSFRDNVSALPPASGDELRLLAFRNRAVRSPAHDLVLHNAPGKTSSYRILHAAATGHKGLIDEDVITDMLDTYAEIVDEAKANPGMHETVDFLIGVKDGDDDLRFVCKVDGEYF